MREGYQEASRLSTRFHSTSRWVLKVLGEFGWSGGGGGGGVSGLEIHLPLDGSEVDVDVDTDGSEEVDGVERLKGGKVIQRRRCKVLEVGKSCQSVSQPISQLISTIVMRYNSTLEEVPLRCIAHSSILTPLFGCMYVNGIKQP